MYIMELPFQMPKIFTFYSVSGGSWFLMYILLSDDLDFLSHSEILGSPFDVRIQCILTSLIPYMFHPFPLREYRRIGLPLPVRHRRRIATGPVL